MPPGTYIYTLKVYTGEMYYGENEAQAYIEVFDKDIWGSDLPSAHRVDNYEKWGQSVLKVPMQNITCEHIDYADGSALFSEDIVTHYTCGYVALATASYLRPAGYTLEFTITDSDPYSLGVFYHIAIERL